MLLTFLCCHFPVYCQCHRNSSDVRKRTTSRLAKEMKLFTSNMSVLPHQSRYNNNYNCLTGLCHGHSGVVFCIVVQKMVDILPIKFYPRQFTKIMRCSLGCNFQAMTVRLPKCCVQSFISVQSTTLCISIYIKQC